MNRSRAVRHPDVNESFCFVDSQVFDVQGAEFAVSKPSVEQEHDELSLASDFVPRPGAAAS